MHLWMQAMTLDSMKAGLITHEYTFDKLNKTFNVESDNTPPTEIVKNENGCVKRSDQATDVDDDY